jgi:hypothetical protein
MELSISIPCSPTHRIDENSHIEARIFPSKNVDPENRGNIHKEVKTPRAQHDW